MSTTTLDLGPVRPVHKGEYSATASYELLNMVSYNGSSWMVITTSYVVGTTPVAGTTWELIASKGDTGANGADGAAGADATIPSGVICMWSGATTAIPDGWALCDGTNDTPNLVNRFIVGAGSTYEVGATGGSSTVTPSGTNASTSVTPSGTVDSTTLTTAQTPSHYHLDPPVSSSASYNAVYGGTLSSTAYRNEVQSDTGTYHGHTSSVGASGSHTHTLTGSASSHTHTFTGTEHTNLPPYYALAYIMKL